MKLAFRVLVVDDDENALAGIVELLRTAEYDVTEANSYEAAKNLLALGSFDLLVTDVRLRSFNGLHLVMKVRAASPDMAIIIMTGYNESMMEIEASRYSAEFVRKPIRPALFLETVARSLTRVRRQRRWPRKRVEGGFRVTVGGLPAAVVDVGYGGLRLEIPATARLPSRFNVEVSGIGLYLEVQSVWSSASVRGNSFVCGAALSSDDTPAAMTWRTIVDRLSA